VQNNFVEALCLRYQLLKMHAHEFKVVTLGEGRVGKTSLSLRFVRDFFREDEI
jgi:GTPase SAR1 family protein